LNNEPEFKVTGDLHLKDGYVENYDFLNWVADTFDLPVRRVDYSDATSNFTVDLQKAGLQEIDLISPDVKIKGDFFISKNSLVNSKISLFLTKELLAKSSKLVAVVRMFDPGVELFNFDFRLSGNQHAMNFQWMLNDFKRTIQSRIPDFIERIIERRIDKNLESTPKSSPETKTP